MKELEKDGYIIIRLWENDINNKINIIEKYFKKMGEIIYGK